MNEPRFPESDLLPISAIQHLIYCERQCALIHVERMWVENRWTAEVRILHDKAHDAKRGESRSRSRRGETGGEGRGVRIARGLPLRSFRLGLFGQADVVEFREAGAGESGEAAGVGANAARSLVLPIEYKRGQPKKHDADAVQLCAQALCLEEMLGVVIREGRLFYGKTRRRQEVAFNAALRERTDSAARRLHEMVRLGRTPPAQYEKEKCDRCSLRGLCMPEMMRPRRTAALTFNDALATALEAR